MSGQDILTELRKRESFCIQRRVVIAATLIFTGYLVTITILKASIQFVGGANQGKWNPVTPPSSHPQAAHLIRAVAQRSSSYPFQSSLLGVTAVITLRNEGESNASSIELWLKFLTHYPFVKEIIIWNDDVLKSGVDLNAEDLLSRLNSTTDKHFLPTLRVINSPGAMREMSNHIACSLANFNTCYHADENRINLNLDTLYTKYLESDGESTASIIPHASPEEYLEESPYNLFQPGHSLNSGIVTQLTRGSLAAKHLSSRYFHQLSSAQLSNENSRLRSSIPNYVFNDIQFSVWSNRRPLKLVTPAQSTVLINPNARGVNHLDHEFIHHTFQRLNETIQASDPFLVPTLFPRALLSLDSKSEPEVGVASAYDDRSMLITDLNFPLEWPLAIDGELSTCWNPSLTITHEESFVGLNFVRSVQLEKITFFGKLDADNWQLETHSTEEKKWNSNRVIPTIIEHHEPPITKYIYDLTKEKNSSSSLKTKIKKIRFKLKPSHSPLEPKSSQNVLSVCGWMVNEDWVI